MFIYQYAYIYIKLVASKLSMEVKVYPSDTINS